METLKTAKEVRLSMFNEWDNGKFAYSIMNNIMDKAKLGETKIIMKGADYPDYPFYKLFKFFSDLGYECNIINYNTTVESEWFLEIAW